MSDKIGNNRINIKREYLKGATSTELATQFSVTHQAILYTLNSLGVPRRPARRRALYDDTKKTKQIIELHLKGFSMPDIAQKYNVSEHTISLLLRQNKIKKHPKNMRTQTITMPTNPAILGYIAGMFDGEGNLQFRDKRSDHRVGCRVTIYSTTPGVADWFQRKMNGGKVIWDNARVARHGWKPMSSWCLYRAQDVAAFLVALYPFLIIKKDVAQKAIKLFSREFGINSHTP